jgi:hypothetical protein
MVRISSKPERDSGYSVLTKFISPALWVGNCLVGGPGTGIPLAQGGGEAPPAASPQPSLKGRGSSESIS